MFIEKLSFREDFYVNRNVTIIYTLTLIFFKSPEPAYPVKRPEIITRSLKNFRFLGPLAIFIFVDADRRVIAVIGHS